jgi:glycosidase
MKTEGFRFSILIFILLTAILFAFSCSSVREEVKAAAAPEQPAAEEREPVKYELDLSGKWRHSFDPSDIGLDRSWQAPGFDDTGWPEMTVPADWGDYDGIGWYRLEFSLKNAPASKYAFVFGSVDDTCTVWLNGAMIAENEHWDWKFAARTDGNLNLNGRNVLAVRVNDLGFGGGIIKPVHLKSYTTDIDLDSFLASEWHEQEARPVPKPVRKMVIYEVFPRIFSRSGDFNGVTERIPTLKEMGVNTIWMMPITPIGEINRKGTLGSPYAVRDYKAINPEYGSIADLRRLIRTAHKNEMKVIIDFVANHSAWDNELLKEHPDWYTQDEKGNIISPNPDWYDVADFNYENKELRKYMIEALKYWVNRIDIDGYRCDVAGMVPTDFWEEARTELEKIKPEIVMLAESDKPDLALKAFDIFYSWESLGALIELLNGGGTVPDFLNRLQREKLHFPKDTVQLRFIENHDIPRALETFTPEKLVAAAVIMFTLDGVPLYYNGMETDSFKRPSLFEPETIDWVEQPLKDIYTTLATIRIHHTVLPLGTETVLIDTGDPDDVYAVLRVLNLDKIFILVNCSDKIKTISIKDLEAQSGIREWYDILQQKVHNTDKTFSLAPYGAVIMRSAKVTVK